MSPIKTIFFGTPALSVPILDALKQDAHFKIVLVVSQMAKPVGREQVEKNSAVAEYALQNQLELFTPKSLRTPEALETLTKCEPDLLVVAAYGKIIPDDVLKVAQRGAINIHPSLLPKYRGASPLQGVIANQETTTGVSIMVMDEQMDHGSILWQESEIIAACDTQETLGQRLFKKAAAA
ncbi:MAG: methionyl-tRNA formyltransferase, partial [bacterium]